MIDRRTLVSAAAVAATLGVTAGTLHAKTTHMKDSHKFISTILLGGTPAENLKAAHEAGFDGVEFWNDDLPDIVGSMAGARDLLAENRLAVTDYQLLSDFDGAPPSKRDGKRREALQLLDNAVAMNAPILAVTASTDPDCDRGQVRDDLAWLVAEARRRGIRLGYEPMSWSVSNPTLPEAWEVLRTLDLNVIGLVVDSYHIFSRGRTADDLTGIPARSIVCAQLGDARMPIPPEMYKKVARTSRLLPGDGDFPLASLIRKLAQIGYDGPVGIEVFNEELLKTNPAALAKRAMTALTRLLEAA